MLPGKTYARPGAFVRKPIKPTSKRKPNDANDDNYDGDRGIQSPKDVLLTAQPFKAALEAAKRAAKNTLNPESPTTQLYDPTSVRERVRNWQSQGGGVVTGPELVVESGDSEDEAEFEDNIASHPTSPIKDRWGARNEKIATKQDVRNRSASPKKGAYDNLGPEKDLHTPRKRIISDGHWRQKPSPAPGKKDRASGEDFERAPREAKPKLNTYLDDGIRVYATPPISRSTSAQNEASEQEEKSDAEGDLPISPQTSEANSENEEDLTPKQARRDEVEQPAVARKETKRTPRGILGAVFQESKRMFARTEIVYVSQPEHPRIDNWLGMIPDLPDDPFVNDEKEKEQEGEEPETAKTTLRRRRRVRAATVTGPDPNGIWDAVSTVDTIPGSAGELHRRQRRRSSKPVNDDTSPTEDGPNRDREAQRSDRLEAGVSKSLGRQNNQQDSSASKDGPANVQPRRNTLGVAALQALFSSPKDGSAKTESNGLQPSRNQASQAADTSSTPRRTFVSAERPRLSTIASMDTLNTDITKSSVVSEFSADSDFTAMPKNRKSQSDLYERSSKDGPRRKKTRLTRHSDLMSVLSVSHNGGKSIKSARSVRTQRTRLGTTTIPDLMKDITNEEARYMQELRTLVDGVIPVLLASVLSQSESQAIANLFSPLGQTSFVRDATYAMGVALEGLKKWHKRLEPSTSGPVSGTVFLTWAQGVHRTYKDYLKAWRMGFQDVVVNLAPAENDDTKYEAFKHGLPRNKDGDITNSSGERVDVAFLLKRPLVRLKSLAKALKDMNIIQPSTLAEKLATDFQDLVVEARRRVNEEKARLEDEAAANMDVTRCRRVDNLAPHPSLTINTTRRVRARDFFDLSLLHSNGQRLDCSVELFLRDDAPGSGNGGDLLICQLDTGGKWLLFPPIDISSVSARSGDSLGEIIVMLRGLDSRGQAWQELLSLIGETETTGSDWLQMLGLDPVPPQLDKTLAEDNTAKAPLNMTLCDSTVSDSLASGVSYSQTSSSLGSQKTQIPLGELTKNSSRVSTSPGPSSRQSRSGSPIRPDDASHTHLQASHRSVSEIEGRPRAGESSPERAISMDATRAPRSLNEAMRMAGSPNSTLHRNRATKKRPNSISTLKPEEPIVSDDQTPNKPPLATLFQQNSSTPSIDLSPISKVRNTDRAEEGKSYQEQKARPTKAEVPSVLQQAQDEEEAPPPPPPHRSPSPIKVSTSPTPDFDPGTVKTKPLSSSPLKHQYEPSSASDDGSDTSSADDDVSDDESESSNDEDSFELDEVPELPQQFLPPRRPPLSQPSLPSKTLGPSSSASQAPYKTVPSQPNKALHIAAVVSYWSDTNQWVQLHPDICNIIVAPGLIEIYEMSSTHAGDADTSFLQPSAPSPAAQPLLVLHLTPMVLLQQGTALDVTIRSPAQGGTMKDTFTSVNFLFRSRSPEEAESLYGMFHHSRMNNPTYIALQQARATTEKPAFDSVFGRDQGRSSSSWFTFGRQKSYRASSAPAPKAKSDPSVGTRTTSFSAKLFGSGRFNIARSSVMSRKSPDGSIFTSSDNSMGSGTSSPLPGVISGTNETPLGLSNTKIRLYSREGNRWLDLGSANLTIMRPTYVSDTAMDLTSPPEVGYAHGIGSNGVITPTQKRGADDKRIVVVKAKKGTVLLDITLGESCFERTARTGIALSLWEIFEGGRVADRGGVTNGRFKYFMMQFQNEAACAFTFSMVGRHRYGANA